MNKRLIVTAGLPGSGKSSVAEALSRALKLPVLSVDPIEAALRGSRIPASTSGLAAYAVAGAIAEENLKLGLSIIVDAVNPVEAARVAWRQMADRQLAALTFVECVCSDVSIHRSRIEARVRGIPGMPEVTWGRVEARRTEYEPWAGNDDRIVVDTTREILSDLLESLQAHFSDISADARD